MTNKKPSRCALLRSIVSMLLCLSMFVGSTFAWFTDSVNSGRNTITAGNLDVELYYSASAAGPWTAVDENTNAFGYDNWEPGFTKVVYFRVVNAGSLALKYQLTADVYAETPGVNQEGNSFKLSQYLRTAIVTTDVTRDEVLAMEGKSFGSLSMKDASVLNTDTHRSDVVGLAIWMPTTVGNEANHNGTQPSIEFGINLLATQYTYENDSFGNDYDADADLPQFGIIENVTGSANVTIENGAIANATFISAGNAVRATVPAGVAVEDETQTLTLSVSKKEFSDGNITAGAGEEMAALDVHIDGVSSENTTPILVELGTIMPIGMNQGNVSLYHVEAGTSNAMTQVLTLAELDAHNEFYYDPATGEVTVALATFSEITLVKVDANPWNGDRDYTWYTRAVVVDDATGEKLYTIANADQFAGFGAIVGGMDNQTMDDFNGDTVKLIANINIGHDEDNLAEGYHRFYPVGYYNSTGSYEKTNASGVTSTVYSFEGTFDGNGHTIANIYQNTWDMFGDYNDGYPANSNHYKDGMGIFGYVFGGKIKNLNVENFSSDGEFTPTGVVAAYADGSVTFENIEIFRSNPRVYNTGNGGIVGVLGDTTEDAGTQVTFRNITVDNSNKITALWGTWDGCCGGIAGMYYGRAKVLLDNCHVGAQIDAFNDVCGNYQYYWYRYSGMLIAAVRTETTDANGYLIPDVSTITATNCTVHFGDWNDYYYCELVDNSLASYTHDHQFSRLDKVKAVDVNAKTVTYMNGTTESIPAEGRVNYVVVRTDSEGKELPGATENADCFHFVNGVQHLHDSKGTEIVGGAEVLKEDKQHVYLPFDKQLFQGWGWGVKNIPVGEFAGVTVYGRLEANSVNKFAVKTDVPKTINQSKWSAEADKGEVVEQDIYFVQGTSIKISELFESTECGVAIDTDNVQVTVSPADSASTANATYQINTTDWTQGTLTFDADGYGYLNVTINDYNYCNPLTVKILVAKYKDFVAKPLVPCFPAAENMKLEHSRFEVRPVLHDDSLGLPVSSFTINDSTIDYSEHVEKDYDIFIGNPVVTGHPTIPGEAKKVTVRGEYAEDWIDLGKNYTDTVRITFQTNASWGQDNARFWIVPSRDDGDLTKKPERAEDQTQFNVNPSEEIHARESFLYTKSGISNGFITIENKAQTGVEFDAMHTYVVTVDPDTQMYTVSVDGGAEYGPYVYSNATGNKDVRYVFIRFPYRLKNAFDKQSVTVEVLENVTLEKVFTSSTPQKEIFLGQQRYNDDNQVKGDKISGNLKISFKVFSDGADARIRFGGSNPNDSNARIILQVQDYKVYMQEDGNRRIDIPERQFVPIEIHYNTAEATYKIYVNGALVENVPTRWNEAMKEIQRVWVKTSRGNFQIKDFQIDVL